MTSSRRRKIELPKARSTSTVHATILESLMLYMYGVAPYIYNHNHFLLANITMLSYRRGFYGGLLYLCINV